MTATRTRRTQFRNAPLNITVAVLGTGETAGAEFAATIRKVDGTSLYEMTWTDEATGKVRGTEYRATDRVWIRTLVGADTREQTCAGECGETLPIARFGTTGVVTDGVMGRATECRKCRDARRAAGRTLGGSKALAGARRADALIAMLRESGTLLSDLSA